MSVPTVPAGSGDDLRERSDAPSREAPTQPSREAPVPSSPEAPRDAPGTNQRGDANGAAWTYLLPSQRLERAVIFGRPSRAGLAGVRRVAREVDIVVDASDARSMSATLVTGGGSLVRVLSEERGVGDGYDLAWITGRGRPAWRAAARRVARVTYREGREVSLGEPALVPRADELALRISPWLGEVRSAVPLDDRRTRRFFQERGLEEDSVRRALAARGVPRSRTLASIVELGGGPARILHRVGRLGGIPSPAQDLPAWLLAIDPDQLGGRRWGLAAKGAYPTQKVVMYCFAGEEPIPDVILKIAPDPTVDALLAHASEGLQAVARAGFVDAGRAPRPLLLARADDIAVSGEAAVHGRAFSRASLGTADCTVAWDAVDGLIDLATRTRADVPASAMALRLATVVERFVDLYDPPAGVRSMLTRAVASVAAVPGTIPSVGVHGDAGPQNLIVDGSGRVVFLDWENWDPAGAPLWDVVHFVRAYAVWATRRRRPLTRVEAVRAQFVDGASLTPFLRDGIAAATRRLDLDPALAWPLAVASLADQAVREAARLPPHRLGSGQFVRVLELFARHEAGPVLRSIFRPGR